MIQVNGLKKAFDGFVALNGVDMHVEKGAIYGLVGPNGAGKSTLIRHLTGVYRPDQGEVQIDGENVYENKAVKSKIAVHTRRTVLFHAGRHDGDEAFL